MQIKSPVAPELFRSEIIEKGIDAGKSEGLRKGQNSSVHFLYIKQLQINMVT